MTFLCGIGEEQLTQLGRGPGQPDLVLAALRGAGGWNWIIFEVPFNSSLTQMHTQNYADFSLVAFQARFCLSFPRNTLLLIPHDMFSASNAPHPGRSLCCACTFSCPLLSLPFCLLLPNSKPSTAHSISPAQYVPVPIDLPLLAPIHNAFFCTSNLLSDFFFGNFTASPAHCDAGLTQLLFISCKEIRSRPV